MLRSVFLKLAPCGVGNVLAQAGAGVNGREEAVAGAPGRSDVSLEVGRCQGQTLQVQRLLGKGCSEQAPSI